MFAKKNKFNLKKKKGGDISECMFAQNNGPFIKTPILGLQSQYDAWQLTNELINVTNNSADMYGNELTNVILKQFIETNNNHSIFLDSCFHHCGEWNQIAIQNQTQSDVLMAWWNYLYQNKSNLNKKNIQKPQQFWFQNYSYPCNSCCNTAK